MLVEKTIRRESKVHNPHLNNKCITFQEGSQQEGNLHKHQADLANNSEFVNSEMRETPGFLFENDS